MKKYSRILALLLALCMIATLFSACGKKYTGGDTLVIAYDKFSQKFSPFFADSGYDQDVVGMTSIGLLGIDREGNPVYNGIEGEVRAYNGTDYTYHGIADLKVTENADGTVDYDITLDKGLKWSDGEPITIDDVLFSMYTLADPTYDGSSTFYAVPIEGMEEYRNSMMTKTDYILSLGEGATDLGDLSQEEYDAFWTADNLRLASVQGLTQKEVSIVASIVKAESNHEPEYPSIAGVYLNRLHQGMRLQADPTVAFCFDYVPNRILFKHLEVDSPYNTYLHEGLPPGPICVPDKASLEAVLNPDRHGYLYFCASPAMDGTHRFATTLSEHNQNARDFQRVLDLRRLSGK